MSDIRCACLRGWSARECATTREDEPIEGYPPDLECDCPCHDEYDEWCEEEWTCLTREDGECIETDPCIHSLRPPSSLPVPRNPRKEE